MLTTFYISLLCLFLIFTIGQQLIYDAAARNFFLNQIQMLIALLLAVIGFPTSFLFIYHLSLVAKNQTTIEHLDQKDRVSANHKLKAYRQRRQNQGIESPLSPRPDPKFNPYNLGSKMENLRAAIGRKWWLWAFPVRDETIGDGSWYPRNLEQNYI